MHNYLFIRFTIKNMSKKDMIDNIQADLVPSEFFSSNGLKIHYKSYGQGKPIILIHGWSSNIKGNWLDTKWVEILTPIRRVIALDCRGHGQSDKVHDQEVYSYKNMAQDVLNLMDHLNIIKADIFGYSMGAMIEVYLLGHHPERITSAILGGIGDDAQDGHQIADALLVEDGSQLSNPIAKAFRSFAELDPNNDLKALALIANIPESTFMQVGGAGLAKVKIPVLIINGENDDLVMNVDKLAATIPGAKLALIQRRDHLTVIPDRRFKKEILSFLES